MLLSTAYFPPIEFFALLAENSVVYLDPFEHYQKQSWRNRCRILVESGPMDLNFPVVHDGDLFHTPVGKVLVDWSTPWLRRTEYAIESAYCSSPFFIYYRDALFSILDSRPDTLWELNMRLIEFFCAKIGIAPQIRLTEKYLRPPVPPEFAPDYREAIHPKRPNTILADMGLDRGYWQVFRDRYGFVKGMSIMDLLFNEGPESICWLKR